MTLKGTTVFIILGGCIFEKLNRYQPPAPGRMQDFHIIYAQSNRSILSIKMLTIRLISLRQPLTRPYRLVVVYLLCITDRFQGRIQDLKLGGRGSKTQPCSLASCQQLTSK